jgi:hypothetical protein
MAVLKNRAKMSTSTTGTGTITLGSAEDGYQTFADAGVANADVVRYVIEDGSNWEIGTGTYTATGTTLSRTVSESSNSDAAINLSGSATVFIGATAEDIPALYADNEDSPAAQPSATGANAVAIGESAVASGYPNAHAFGRNAQATGARSLAIGYGADATGTWSTALGNWNFTGPVSAGSNSVAIGGAYASGTDSFAAGISSTSSTYGATGVNSIAIGQLAKATQANSIAIGDTATSTTANLIALGGTTDTVQISGTYTLPTADGTNGQVLTTDGSGAVTFADAGGGGGTDLFAENYDGTSTLPSATGTNAVAIGKNASAAGSGGFSAGNAADASGTNAVALGRANTASGQNAFSFGFSNTASGTYAIAIHGNATADETTAIGRNSGGNPATATTGQGAMALGGSYASGTDSLAAAIANNTSSYGATANSSIAIGNQAKATGSYATTLGRLSTATGTGAVALGVSNTAIGTYSHALGYNSTASQNYAFVTGRSNTASGTYSTIWGGYSSQATTNQACVLNGFVSNASHEYSTTIGAYARTRADHAVSFGSSSFGSGGAGQSSLFTLVSDTTDATPEALTSKNSSPATDNQVTLPNNSAYAFHGTIVARQQAADGTACAAWKVEGLIRREANAGTTVLVNSATTVLDNTPNWGMALSADTTNGGLAITCTGAASTDIRWVATIHTSEVIYA